MDNEVKAIPAVIVVAGDPENTIPTVKALMRLGIKVLVHEPGEFTEAEDWLREAELEVEEPELHWSARPPQVELWHPTGFYSVSPLERGIPLALAGLPISGRLQTIRVTRPCWILQGGDCPTPETGMLLTPGVMFRFRVTSTREDVVTILWPSDPPVTL